MLNVFFFNILYLYKNILTIKLGIKVSNGGFQLAQLIKFLMVE